MLTGLTLVNLTPHAIVLDNGVDSLTVEPSGSIARVSVELVETAVTGLYSQVFGDVAGLPEPVEGTLYIVSAMVLSAVPHRVDVYAPATALAARNELGHIVSVPGLVR